jgi:hypothetical protein
VNKNERSQIRRKWLAADVHFTFNRAATRPAGTFGKPPVFCANINLRAAANNPAEMSCWVTNCRHRHGPP